MRTRIRALGLMLALVALPDVVKAERIVLDFERFPGPDGQLGTADDLTPGADLIRLMDEFSSVGVIFAQGTLGQSEFFDGNPENHFITSTPPVAFLTVPVFGITIESNSFWNATLTAFDANNAILGTATLLNATPGISPRRGILSVNSRVPINQFSVLPPEAGEILNLDNLVLTPNAVPEPTTLTLRHWRPCSRGATRESDAPSRLPPRPAPEVPFLGWRSRSVSGQPAILRQSSTKWLRPPLADGVSRSTPNPQWTLARRSAVVVQ
jgi:hypothetical protein